MAEEYILAQPETITLRAEDADRLLALGSGDAALLYLWLLRNGGRFDPARAARELKTAGGLPAAMALAERYQVEMPIISEINRILFEGKPAADAVRDLMIRDPKVETPALPWD